ncbi:Platz transcription factor family protein, partial [Thalictrum thalictroides]
DENMRSKDPSWVFSFLSEKFFKPCVLHEDYKKNERNIFCLNCFTSICAHCVNLHNSHFLLQVRRYVYHDVVRLEDLDKLFDCLHVQPYTTNKAKVVFLNQRPQTRLIMNNSGVFCHTCDRVIQEPYHFCSFACKIQYLMVYEGSISRYMNTSTGAMSLSIDTYMDELKEIDERQMTPESVLDHGMTSSSSSTSAENLTVVCTASSFKVTKRKRSVRVPVGNCNPRSTDAVPVRVHRRKGLPVRSLLL